ncbi:MAG: hypothetical protein IC227_11255 [Enterococcus lacertideformus]|uniref:Uncharacterized protein n=1 Tax=Enterococcus lacertideformus TaxID=2771493 RepID=A0A931FAH1_9ENTE|nr:hypothetical protein [Enterococcus lacertideformus]
MKIVKRTLALGLILGVLTSAIQLSAEKITAETNVSVISNTGEWGNEEGKFPDQGPELIKEFTHLTSTNWEMLDFSAKWQTTGTYTGTHNLIGELYAQNMPDTTLTRSVSLTSGQLTGIRYDGTTKTWPLVSPFSKAESVWRVNHSPEEVKLTFGLFNESISPSEFKSFKIDMVVFLHYHVDGWEYMMGINPQYKTQTFSFSF